MKTLLVISNDARLIQAINVGIDASHCRLCHVERSGDAAQFDVGSIHAVLVDAGNDPVGAMATLGQMRQIFPMAPLALLADGGDSTLDEAVWRAGAQQLFRKPLHPARVIAWLDTHDVAAPTKPSPPPSESTVQPTAAPSSPTPDRLGVVGDLGDVIEHGLDPAALTREFLGFIRGVLGCNRAAIYFCAEGDVRLGHPIGISPARLQTFQPTPTTGVVSWLSENGRVASLAQSELKQDAATVAEMTALGIEVAIPIHDEGALVGFAGFDRRVTGGDYDEAELSGLYRAFETFGIALANARSHARLERRDQLSAGTLDSLGTACVVVGSSLELLHINAAARKVLGLLADSTVHDLPPAIASKLFVAIEKSEETETFVQRLGDGDKDWRIRIRRLPDPKQDDGRLALMTLTPIEQTVSPSETDGQSTRELIRAMAEHLAHEIGNALVPISTTQQLLGSGEMDAGTQKELVSVMTQSVNRISRLTGQMQTLSREGLRRVDEFLLGPLLDEAFREAGARVPNCKVGLNRSPNDDGPLVHGERPSLKQLFTEVLLNALQSAPDGSPVEVTVSEVTERNEGFLAVEIGDSGSGFEPETARRATHAFYSSRSVGMGLGLTVAERILELHGGRLEIESEQPVRILIPREPVSSAADQSKTSA